MERIAFGELALAALSHRPALGWEKPLSAASKYALTYLFAQSEFGLLCPVNMTDSLTRTIRRFADQALLARYLPGLLADDPDRQLQGAMFMTERFAGSDVGATATRAAPLRRPLAAAMATSGSARTPMRIWRWCWRGPRARRRGPPASACS